MPRKIAVLGSTGSIGVQALDVISRSPHLELYSIVCGTSREMLEEQRGKYHPRYAACALEEGDDDVLSKAVEGADMVLNAIVGGAGLQASILTQAMNKPLALANKESLVIGSDLLQSHLSSNMIIPVDSEHSTIYRCIQGEDRRVKGITLTASGGSLRDTPMEDVFTATPEQVLRHPTWEMGGRITVDSASMVNKAFEVLEARALFPGIPIDVVLHRKSIVHSFVESADGAWKALMGLPDMKVPIAWALLYPDLPALVAGEESPLDWGELTFEPLNERRYPAFRAVLDAGDAGGLAPAAANAADEVAVKAFLNGAIPFGAIAEVIGNTVDRSPRGAVEDFNCLLEADRSARRTALEEVERI